MIGLLDTHTFIWCDSDPTRLSAPATSFLLDPANIVLLSVVSVWEMQIKAQLSRLALRAPIVEIVTGQLANGIQVLPVYLNHVLALEGLPNNHKDPFDRLLIAQAKVEGAVVLTADEMFRNYPVSVWW